MTLGRAGASLGLLRNVGGQAMRALRTVAMVSAVILGLAGAAARADSLEDALFAACVASGTYRDLPISESETCHCVAGIVPQHLTPKATKQITEATGEGYVLDGASYIGGYGPVSTALHVQCPSVKAHWDRTNRPADACKDAFKTHRDAVVRYGGYQRLDARRSAGFIS